MICDSTLALYGSILIGMYCGRVCLMWRQYVQDQQWVGMGWPIGICSDESEIV